MGCVLVLDSLCFQEDVNFKAALILHGRLSSEEEVEASVRAMAPSAAVVEEYFRYHKCGCGLLLWLY